MDTSSSQEIFEAIKNYNCFNEKGFLDLEMFCVVLSKSFYADGILELCPEPREIYNLLIELLQESASKKIADPGREQNANELMEIWVSYQKLEDWTHEFYEVYPDKYRTLIHPAGYVHVQSYWIYHIGYTLMGLPEPKEPRKYYDWVRPEWVHVYAYIDGHHNQWWDVVKEIDRQHVEEGQVSTLEIMHKSIIEGIDYDKASKALSSRKQAQNSTLVRINDAITAGFYLEAISLQECLISNCLYNYITAKREGKTTDSSTLYNMIKTIKRKKSPLNAEDNLLFDEVDDWRRFRNKAIHGFIQSQTNKLEASLEDFLVFAEKTAKQGQDLCQKVCSWYDDQSVQFINIRFPEPKKTSVH